MTNDLEQVSIAELKTPSKEKLEEMKQRELDAIQEQGKQCDTNTILGRLERSRLLIEYDAVANGKKLDYHKAIRDEDGNIQAMTMELTEYGKIMEQIKLIKQSNLGNIMDKYRFNNFNRDKPHHKLMYSKAQDFLREPTMCFATLGQVGSGKTHICTALVSELMIEHNKQVKYMLWTDEVQRIKFTQDLEYRNQIMNGYKNAEVLYIDDLLKVQSRIKLGRNERPIDKIKDADIDIATEIIFYRYINNKMTIISSEHSLSDLLQVDQAMASRLEEMSNGYIVVVEKDVKRNERLA